MERVSFKVSKAIKEAGYPQTTRPQACFDENGRFYSNGGNYLRRATYDAPYAMEVWLWLWREKKFSIDVCLNLDAKWTTCLRGMEFDDPEEAIIAAIEYLVENDLIKK